MLTRPSRAVADVGHRPAEHTAQVSVGGEVVVVMEGGEERGVDQLRLRRARTRPPPRRQRGAQDFKDTALALREEQWA